MERSVAMPAIDQRPRTEWSASATEDIVNSGSISDLLLLHRDVLLRYLLAHGAGDHAEDIVQDIWLKAQRSGTAQEVTRAYLIRMAHNAVIDHARSSRQRHHRDHRWHVEGVFGGDVDPTPDAERALMARERLAKVEEALRKLGPRIERIVRRHRVDAVPQKQIAIEEGLSLSSVEKNLATAYRAIAMVGLRLDIGQEYDR